MENIVSLAKRRGFIFAGSDIYGGLANSWDYGPLGVELKNNIKQEWWKRFVQQRADVVGIDAALLMNSKVWEASGHLVNFTDLLVECKKCHARFRADQLVSNQDKYQKLANEIFEYFTKFANEQNLWEVEQTSDGKLIPIATILENRFNHYFTDNEYFSGREKDVILDFFKKLAQELEKDIDYDIDVDREGWISAYSTFRHDFMDIFSEIKNFQSLILQLYLDREAKCSVCGERNWSESKQFNLMLKTYLGPSEESANTVYFRPETAQAMFVNFKNVIDTNHPKIPFGIAQQGKAFRNEITPGNFIFRMREFEQMEIEYFVKESEWEKHFEYWLQEMKRWLKDLGVSNKKLHYIDIPDGERAHYSKRTVDIEYEYPFGQKELYGLAYRGDFDLKNHMEASGQDLRYMDAETKEKFLPHVIEPTWGVDRSVLVAILEAYHQEEAPTAEEGESATRVVMKFPAWLAPVKVAVLPLSKKEELSKVAKAIFEKLSKQFVCEYDETQSIGKRYRRQDEIGTPFVVTVDFESLKDKKVTLRDRDTMKQERIAIKDLVQKLHDKFIL